MSLVAHPIGRVAHVNHSDHSGCVDHKQKESKAPRNVEIVNCSGLYFEEIKFDANRLSYANNRSYTQLFLQTKKMFEQASYGNKEYKVVLEPTFSGREKNHLPDGIRVKLIK